MFKSRRNGLFDHRMGTLIQPLRKPMAKMINGVDIPNMIMYGKGVFIGFSPSRSPAVCQYLHITNPPLTNAKSLDFCYETNDNLLFWFLFFSDELLLPIFTKFAIFSTCKITKDPSIEQQKEDGIQRN